MKLKIFGRRKKKELVRVLKELCLFGLGLILFALMFSYWLEVSPETSQEEFNRAALESQKMGWERQAHFRRMAEEHGDRWLMQRTNQ